MWVLSRGVWLAPTIRRLLRTPPIGDGVVSTLVGTLVGGIRGRSLCLADVEWGHDVRVIGGGSLESCCECCGGFAS